MVPRCHFTRPPFAVKGSWARTACAFTTRVYRATDAHWGESIMLQANAKFGAALALSLACRLATSLSSRSSRARRPQQHAVQTEMLRSTTLFACVAAASCQLASRWPAQPVADDDGSLFRSMQQRLGARRPRS